MEQMHVSSVAFQVPARWVPGHLDSALPFGRFELKYLRLAKDLECDDVDAYVYCKTCKQALKFRSVLHHFTNPRGSHALDEHVIKSWCAVQDGCLQKFHKEPRHFKEGWRRLAALYGLEDFLLS